MLDRRWRLFLLFALVSVATRWLSLAVDVLDIDETCHIVGAWVVLRGGMLYTDFVDNKPPLVYAFYAAAQVLAGRGLWSVHLLTALIVVPLTALGVSACYRHTRVGLVAATVYLLYSSAFIAHDMLATNAEVLMVLPGTWAIVVVSGEERARARWRPALAGLLVGVGVLFKPHVAAWVAAVAVVLFWARRDRGWLRAAMGPVQLALGVLVPLGATLAWYWARGGVGAFLYWVGVQNLWYAQNPITLREAVTRCAAYFVPFLVVTAPLFYAWWRSLPLVQARYWRLLLSALVVSSVPPVLLGFRFFPHYFIQFYVPLALTSAPWIASQLSPPVTRAGRVLVAWTAVVVVAFTAANAYLYLGHSRVYRERDPAFREIAGRLQSDVCARNGSLFVWGWAPIIYYFADMPAASRFVVLPQSRLTGYVFGNIASNRGESDVGNVEVPEHWDWLMDDLERHRATFIVDTAPANVYRWGRYPIANYPRLLRYVEQEFEPVADVGRMRLYRRRGCEEAARAAPGP